MGDAWAAYYAFELQQGTEAEQKDVLDRCVRDDCFAAPVVTDQRDVPRTPDESQRAVFFGGGNT